MEYILNIDTMKYVENSIIEHAEQGVFDIFNDMDSNDTFDIDDLHHRLFNEDYFVIGHGTANEWIKDNNLNAFDLISDVQEYEKENFGEVTTDITPESIVNMYVYIQGENFLHSLDLDYENTKYSKMQMFDVYQKIKDVLKMRDGILT